MTLATQALITTCEHPIDQLGGVAVEPRPTTNGQAPTGKF